MGGYVEWEGEGGKEEVCALADIESDFARETKPAAAEKEVEWGEQRRDDGARCTWEGISRIVTYLSCCTLVDGMRASKGRISLPKGRGRRVLLGNKKVGLFLLCALQRGCPCC